MPDPVPGRADRADRSRSALASVLSRTALLRFAGEASFERGERYAADGSVSALVEDAGVVAARVRGTRLYRVRLWVEGSGGGGSVLGFSCTCPVGADGACCKHCVATGLVWLARSEGAGREGAGGGGSHDPAITMDDVRAHAQGIPGRAAGGAGDGRRPSAPALVPGGRQDPSDAGGGGGGRRRSQRGQPAG